MRQRETLKISRESGDAVATTEVLDDDAGFAQRITGLKDSVPDDIDPVEARYLGVRCDGCGTAAELDFDDPRYPDGWAEREDGDFCPACQTLHVS